MRQNQQVLMRATHGDSLFFYVRVPRSRPALDFEEDAAVFYMQHQLVNKVFPLVSDRECKAIKKVSFIIDLELFSSSNSFAMVERPPCFSNGRLTKFCPSNSSVRASTSPIWWTRCTWSTTPFRSR